MYNCTYVHVQSRAKRFEMDHWTDFEGLWYRANGSAGGHETETGGAAATVLQETGFKPK